MRCHMLSDKTEVQPESECDVLVLGELHKQQQRDRRHNQQDGRYSGGHAVVALWGTVTKEISHNAEGQ